jgi:hypothetical protein
MYSQGVNKQFTDWHHPFLPILMMVSRTISNDTSFLLFIQLACLWTGVYLFSLSLKNQIGRWAVLSILIAYTPIILNQLGYLGKTTLQTATFLLVFGACYYYYSTKKRPVLQVQLLLLFALFLGTTIRGYSYISAIPITAFFVYISIIKFNFKAIIIKVMSLTLVILTMFFIIEKLTIYKALNVEQTYKSANFFEYDLAGIMANSGKLYSHRLLLPEFRTHEAILENYQKHNGAWRIIEIYGKDKKRNGRVYQNVFNSEDKRFLFNEWISAITDNPFSYLKHRYHAISFSLGFKNKVWGIQNKIIFRKDNHKNGLRNISSLFWIIFKKYNIQFQQTIFFKPWFWFILNILIFLISTFLLFKRNYSQKILPHAVLNSSGTLFYVTYLFICLSPSARYVYWGTVATALSTFGIAAIIVKHRFLKFRW